MAHPVPAARRGRSPAAPSSRRLHPQPLAIGTSPRPASRPPASPCGGTPARRFSCCRQQEFQAAASMTCSSVALGFMWDCPALARLSLASSSLDRQVNAALEAVSGSTTVFDDSKTARRLPHRSGGLPNSPGRIAEAAAHWNGDPGDHRPSRDHRRWQDLRRDLLGLLLGAVEEPRQDHAPVRLGHDLRKLQDAGQAEPPVSQRLHHLGEPPHQPGRDLAGSGPRPRKLQPPGR